MATAAGVRALYRQAIWGAAGAGGDVWADRVLAGAAGPSPSADPPGDG